MQYTTVHIGDGLIAKLTDDKTEIISYPENGINKKHTYFVNSRFVLKHCRMKKGLIFPNQMFFLATDGSVEKCYVTEDYVKRIKEIKKSRQFFTNDDCSYIFIVSTDKI